MADAGLEKDTDYTLQGTGLGLKNDDNQTQKPDVIVNLPENKHIIIDAKVSLTDYERFCNADEETERTEHLKRFMASVQNHIKDLHNKSYSALNKLNSPDFVLMFMPIEGSYFTVMKENPELHNDAWAKKIVIVCPTTLFATLRTIASIWRLERQNQNAVKIARQGELLYKKVSGFVEDMQKLEKSLKTASQSYDDAFSKLHTGRGNIIKRTEKLKQLGVTSSKNLPTNLISDDSEDDEQE